MLIGEFCETFPPSLDGVGRVMLSYCQMLDQLGHRAIYIAPENPAYSDDVGCETILYGGIRVPNEPYYVGSPRFSAFYRKAIRPLSFDVVHAHSPFLAGRAAQRIAKKRNIPLVATFHSKYYDDFYRATGSKTLARLGIRYILSFYKACDEVWAVNEKTADVLRGYGFQGEIITMPNGTDCEALSEDEYADALRPYALPKDIPIFLFVGQQDFKKNTKSILEACGLLKKRGMDFRLLMVGGGQDLRRLMALSQTLGLSDQVIFTGFISDRRTTLALHRRADLLVFPSIYDNAPMVVREAAAMGTPSLLIENTCAAEGVIHGENGYLCQNSPQSIADGIAAALPTVRQVGERARQTIPIPWLTIVQNALARYTDLAAAKSKGAVHETSRA
ncbi:MAG: glycosyltransferase [Eubacteriales bacterium]|nr:glycosyltransferase [Eubacteriales bacterium]